MSTRSANSIQVHFRFTSDSIQIQFTLEVTMPRLQLITTTLVDLNYCWQYEPMRELCAGGILVAHSTVSRAVSNRP
ncbi:hypothetical protein VN97_g2290 [Penicillium thymicola]|uniref:Uncharacterized protein n=1 Tax=Penicillium thymicola TaxID=293382 RepID=A0AAI9TPV8_PENTH|nr:hypothetical protein VN97_g2290 [Penicillium thymicola]